jgi:hypothetical protein
MLQMPESHIDVHRREITISLADLWLRCFALGTVNTATELEAFLRGAALPTRHEYNVIAVALNEYFADIGLRQSVPYAEDNAPLSTHCLGSAAVLVAHPSLVTVPNG